MAQIINTNIPSLNAQRNLNTSQSSLAVSLERLSTGLRINSAKDDAAGLAIAERFTTQIRGLNQAIRNANDGISFAQTAEGALGTVSDALQRIRELAVQAVNDTNSSSDRQALNNEVSQLLAEVNRVANSTQFNGKNILDGSSSSLTFQVGANQGASFASSTLLASTETLNINGTDIDLAPVDTATGLVDAINLVSADTGVQAQKASSTSVDLAYTADADDARVLTVNNVDITIAINATADDVETAINAVTNATGVTATNNAGTITFSNTSGEDISIAQNADTTTNTDIFAGLDTANGAAAGAALSETFSAGIVLSTDVGESPTISISAGALADVGIDDSFDDNVLSAVNVLTGTAASDALATLDFALNQVNGLRAELGAVQTRFESTISNLSITSENLSASRSRIQDADFAAETANLTRAQILQQAGTAILGQANALPQNVLSLLG